MNKLFQSNQPSKIRVESNLCVTHYCSKYYHVVHDETSREDYLKLISGVKIIYKVKALSVLNNAITYEEIV